MSERVWTGYYAGGRDRWKSELVAVWEAARDPISDDYLVEDASAEELLARWVEEVQRDFPDGLVPIFWFVAGRSAAIFEAFPGSRKTWAKDRDFLSFFSWPEDAETGELLNWMELPVADKLWRPGRADKGGFIQEATGWKPSVAQPYLYLPALLNARR